MIKIFPFFTIYSGTNLHTLLYRSKIFAASPCISITLKMAVEIRTIQRIVVYCDTYYPMRFMKSSGISLSLKFISSTIFFLVFLFALFVLLLSVFHSPITVFWWSDRTYDFPFHRSYALHLLPKVPVICMKAV